MQVLCFFSSKALVAFMFKVAFPISNKIYASIDFITRLPTERAASLKIYACIYFLYKNPFFIKNPVFIKTLSGYFVAVSGYFVAVSGYFVAVSGYFVAKFLFTTRIPIQAWPISYILSI